MAAKKRVLSVAKTDLLRRARQADLTRAGYSVVSATDFNQIESLSRTSGFDVAIIGYAFEPEVKRMIAEVIRRYFPQTPIVELTQAEQEIPDAISSRPEDPHLRATLKAVLENNQAKKAHSSN
jgi:DNA-binding response OmpR family regulator